jgi:hypothetical protein
MLGRFASAVPFVIRRNSCAAALQIRAPQLRTEKMSKECLVCAASIAVYTDFTAHPLQYLNRISVVYERIQVSTLCVLRCYSTTPHHTTLHYRY